MQDPKAGKGASAYKPHPHSPRARANEAIGGARTGFENVPAMYDSAAGVPKAMTRGDSKPDLNPSPFSPRAESSPGPSEKVPYTTGS